MGQFCTHGSGTFRESARQLSELPHLVCQLAIQHLQRVPVGRRQHRLRKARPPRRHRHHPDRRPVGQLRAGRHRISRRRLVRACPAEDPGDRFPGDLQPGQPLPGPRQPLFQPRELTAQFIHLAVGCRLTPLQFPGQRSHRTSPRSYPEQYEMPRRHGRPACISPAQQVSEEELHPSPSARPRVSLMRPVSRPRARTVPL